jgi:arginyl-tRNA synthetase
MGKVIDTDELLVFITDKAFSIDTFISDSEHICWLHARLKDFYEARGESFDFINERIDVLNGRIETLMSVKRSGYDIFEKLNAIFNERIKTRWEAIDVKLDTFGTEGLLTNTGLIMPLRSEISHLAMLDTRKRLMDWERIVTFNKVDDAIQALQDDFQEIVQEFDNFFAINN